jgi:hypothetical protein
MVACRIFGHRYVFTADGAELRWACRRCGDPGGVRRYDTAREATRYADAFNREDRSDIGRRAPLLGMFPLRLYRALRARRTTR